MALSNDDISEFVEFLEGADLRYISYNSPGISRKKQGQKFKYFTSQGKTVNISAEERITSLAIPSAWKEVWISPSPSGYLQATGIDNKGRRQYIYHPKWK